MLADAAFNGGDSMAEREGTPPSTTVHRWWGRTKDGYDAAVDRLYTTVLSTPATVLILFLLISGVFAQQGLAFQEQIDDDVEIFLPDGASSSEELLEVRKEWSTDLVVIYIQTPNAFNTADTTNITNEAYLREISWIEGDDTNIGGDSTGRGIDYDKNDNGRNDGVLWVLSAAQVIKEINSADGRFNASMCEHGLNNRLPVALNCDQLPPGGDYAIPDQDRIDRIIEESDGAFDTFFKDTNDMDPTVDSDGDGNYTNDMDGDGIWDTTAIVVGLHHNPSVTGDWEDFSSLLAHFQDVIDARPSDLRSTDMTVTGLTKVLEDISDAIYEDLMMILPWSVAFTVLIITALHRSWKVVVITGTPIIMALGVTFGSSVILNITLTPMIVATFPILIGLGVDYALHMVNRIEEVRRKELDKAMEHNRRQERLGQPTQPLPEMWDVEFYKSCVIEMTRSTGVAVLLSGLTTIVGFSVLIAPFIVPIAPIRSVGITLVIGIASTLLLSIVLVPTLAWMLRFSKRSNPPMWKNIGRAPVRGFLIILVLSASVTTYGLANLDKLNEPITGSSEAPDGIESLNALSEYSRQFSSGQTSLFTYDASSRPNQNQTEHIRDLPVLDDIDWLETKVDNVDETSTTSIITFLKSVPAEVTIVDGVTLGDGSLWDLLHNPCWESEDLLDPSCVGWTTIPLDERRDARKDMVAVAIDTLSNEVQSMLLNEDQTKAIVYVTQPYMNLNVAGGLRDQIDDILIEGPTLPGTQTSLLTGGLPVSLDINEGIHESQSKTTVLTLIILTVVLAMVFRSLRLGIYTMIPVATVILWQPLLMQSGDVNVNIFTAMIGTIVFGIGVDDSIHVMHRIQEEGETPHGMASSVEQTGQTVFETTATTVSGIAAGFLAAFPGLENFFMLMSLLIIFAFLTSVFLLPSLITAEHVVRAKVNKHPSWIDFGDEVAVGHTTAMKPVDAVLET